jgi:Ca-activated chloride channel family protein
MPRWPAALLLAAGVFTGPASAQQEPPVFRGRSDAVRVFVTVTDRDGRLVTTLAQNDFEIRDQGKPQPIVLFDNSPQPIRLVVMLDVSGSMAGNLPLLRDASEELFRRLRSDDLVKVGAFGEDVHISETFTRDAGALADSLPRTIVPDAPTPLWRALDAAMNAFDREAEERRVVLVLSDGKDSGPIGFRQPVASQAEVIERARRDDVMIYAVGMRSRRRQTMMPGVGPEGLRAAMLDDLPDPGLARVAEETGGGYAEIRPGEDLAEAFTRVADELHGQYLLGFAPPKRDGKAHELDVHVTGKGLKPRARRSYVAPRS